MASIKEKVIESAEQIKEGASATLLGTEDDPKLPAQTRADFMQHAIKDDETGEYYMGQTEFVNAIAPIDEDYVSTITISYAYLLHLLHQHNVAY